MAFVDDLVDCLGDSTVTGVGGGCTKHMKALLDTDSAGSYAIEVDSNSAWEFPSRWLAQWRVNVQSCSCSVEAG